MTPRTAYRYVPRTIRHTSEAGVTFEAHCPPTAMRTQGSSPLRKPPVSGLHAAPGARATPA